MSTYTPTSGAWYAVPLNADAYGGDAYSIRTAPSHGDGLYVADVYHQGEETASNLAVILNARELRAALVDLVNAVGVPATGSALEAAYFAALTAVLRATPPSDLDTSGAKIRERDGTAS